MVKALSKLHGEKRESQAASSFCPFARVDVAKFSIGEREIGDG